MKKVISFFQLLMVVALLLTTCQPVQAVAAPPAQDEDVLYLNLVWHQHQPMYYKDADGIYTRPWVRVHATKDYYDMAATVARYPQVHVSFNLTPVLLMQLEDFVTGQAKDRYWVLTEKPANSLSLEEKDFLLRRFFDADWDHMVRVHPGYRRLLDKRGDAGDAAIANALKQFTEQDYRDLQIWFNLAWFDPDNLAAEPLKTLVQKDHDFAEADKTMLFQEVRKVMAEVIPIHRKLQDAGQIEVITTPYAHPILPLIYDSKLAVVGNDKAEQPRRYQYVQDAVAQVKKSVEIYQRLFGRQPVGLWPAEGAVAQPVVPIISREGYQWMASGEQVLANSLGIGAFTRDAADTVQEADQFYRPYQVAGPEGGPIQGPPMMMVFRDNLISDKLGFTYSGTPGDQAAADFMRRMENIRARLKAQGASGPHLVSVILDGENAWQNYDNDGKAFLNALYRNLEESKTIRTITPSEYLKKFPEQRKLEKLFPGAWFSANYDTWIGEPEETAAWNLLYRVRKDLAEYDTLKHKTAPSAQALAKALDAMYLAEGSDWFWWYGSDQDSGSDTYFDEGFRALLGQVYQALGEPVPAAVKVPIIPRQSAAADRLLTAAFTPRVDGTASEKEWQAAAYYPVSGGAQARTQDVVKGIWMGVDRQNLYLRLDAGTDWKQVPDARVGVYVASPRQQKTSGVSRLSQSAAEPFLLGFGATTLFETALADKGGLVYQPQGSEWKAVDGKVTAAARGSQWELSAPLSALGELQEGDTLRLAVVVSSGGADWQLAPAEGPAQMTLPELTQVNYFLDVKDPQGDDHGPGSYTYPTDAVFTPGSFDVLRFQAGSDGQNLVFRFTFAGDLVNPWNGPNGFSVQTMDVYVDKDPGKGSGARLLLPGRNAALKQGSGWEVALWAESWTPQMLAPDASTLEPKPLNASFQLIANPGNKTITLRAPLSAFGPGDPKQWGYAAGVLSQEGFPADGVWRVRDVDAAAAQWRFGGAPQDANHTRLIDWVWAAGETQTQEKLLSGYSASSQPAKSLGADDFAQMELMLVR